MSKSVVLRSVQDEGGTRQLSASLNGAGDLLIEGHELGPAVEEILGDREYEWTWTVRAARVPALLSALGEASDVLKALAERFSGEKAADLYTFLRGSGVPYESWSRTGD